MLNGAFIESKQATISALDRALTHGLGLYETIKLREGTPIFFDEHSARLEHGLAQVGIEAPCDRHALADQIVRLSAASGIASGACRVLVTAGAPGGKPALLIQTEVRPLPTHPLTLISSRTLRAAAALKSNSFIASHIAQRAAKAAGADDAVFVDEEGRLYEATTANVFIVRGGTLSTAPTNGAILPGVIRAKMMELAQTAGIPASERHTLVTDLTEDDSLLLTSSVRGIVAAGSIDGRRLRQDDEFLARLRLLLSNAERASATAFTATYR